MSGEYNGECPRDGCDGEIEYREETSESYTAHGLLTWTHVYLVMDVAQCSDGRTFTPSEVERLERDATDAWQSQPPCGFP